MIDTLLVDLAVAQTQTDGYSATPPAATGRLSGGESTSTPSGADGEGAAAAAPFGGDFFMILILVMVAMLGFSFMSGRKQKKQRQSMLDAMGKKDTVQTVGGIIGTVVDLKDDHAVLCVHEGSNTRLTVARSAIQTILTVSGDTTPEADADAGEDTEA